MTAAALALRAGKTHAELVELEDTIEGQLDRGEAADPEYWAAVLKRLHVAKVRAKGAKGAASAGGPPARRRQRT